MKLKSKIIPLLIFGIVISSFSLKVSALTPEEIETTKTVLENKLNEYINVSEIKTNSIEPQYFIDSNLLKTYLESSLAIKYNIEPNGHITISDNFEEITFSIENTYEGELIKVEKVLPLTWSSYDKEIAENIISANLYIQNNYQANRLDIDSLYSDFGYVYPAYSTDDKLVCSVEDVSGLPGSGTTHTLYTTRNNSNAKTVCRYGTDIYSILPAPTPEESIINILYISANTDELDESYIMAANERIKKYVKNNNIVSIERLSVKNNNGLYEEKYEKDFNSLDAETCNILEKYIDTNLNKNFTPRFYLVKMGTIEKVYIIAKGTEEQLKSSDIVKNFKEELLPVENEKNNPNNEDTKNPNTVSFISFTIIACSLMSFATIAIINKPKKYNL